jgi:N-acylglucosamine 2-epimerase
MNKMTSANRSIASRAVDDRNLYNQYRSLLLDNIVPFWFKYGIDWEYGGVLSCMNDDGSLASGDKFIWSQARSVWTFSALYNRVEKRPEFLAAAKNSIRFLLAHGRDESGRWVYRTDQKGHIMEGAISIYSDCFIVYGFSEYYRAVHDERVLSIAWETFKRVRCRIEEPDFQETAPYLLPLGWKNHSIPMIMTEVTNELLQTTADINLEPFIDDYVGRIMGHFVQPKRKVLLEFLTKDYKNMPPPAGTFVMPGHAIESMWFVMHVAQRRGNTTLIQRAAEVMRWHLEIGWDPEYGGIFLSRDAEGHKPYLPHSDKKLWWPHVEALYATLLAHELTGEPWCLEWYGRVADWAWSHFPIPKIGEWYQRLTREGKPTQEIIALPVKDPFHLPRAAILITQLMKRAQMQKTGDRL